MTDFKSNTPMAGTQNTNSDLKLDEAAGLPPVEADVQSPTMFDDQADVSPEMMLAVKSIDEPEQISTEPQSTPKPFLTRANAGVNIVPETTQREEKSPLPASRIEPEPTEPERSSTTGQLMTQADAPVNLPAEAAAEPEPAPVEPDNAPSDDLDAQVAGENTLAAESAKAQPELLDPEPEAQDISDAVAPDTGDTAIATTTEATLQSDRAVKNNDRDPMLAGKKSKADIAIALMNKSTTFFHTPEKEPYAMIWKEDHFEVWPVFSKEFELWVRYLYYQHTQSAIKKPDLATAIQEAEASALFAGPEEKVWLRVARHEGAIYIDIGNTNWEQIEITSQDWRIVRIEESPVKFRRTKGMLALPHPEHNGDLNQIRGLLNLENDGDFCLIVSYMLGAMNPSGPFPILIVQGEQGTGKSTLTNCIRSLIDPSTVPSRTLPRTVWDLAISAEASRLLCYDNISGIKDGFSDVFCSIATGGGFGVRERYTTKGQALFTFSRPMIFNGISDIVVKHDFADRAMVVTLPLITADKRRPMAEIKREWQSLRPSFLGALCDAVVQALRNHDDVVLGRSPRMADFAKWVSAAEPALPWEPGQFMAEFEKNRFELIEVAIESDPISLSVMEMMNRLDGAKEWTGTPTNLLKALSGYVPNNGANKKGWPQAPNIFTNRLRRVQTFLRAKGVDVEHSKSGSRFITLKMRSQGALG